MPTRPIGPCVTAGEEWQAFLPKSLRAVPYPAVDQPCVERRSFLGSRGNFYGDAPAGLRRAAGALFLRTKAAGLAESVGAFSEIAVDRTALPEASRRAQAGLRQ